MLETVGLGLLRELRYELCLLHVLSRGTEHQARNLIGQFLRRVTRAVTLRTRQLTGGVHGQFALLRDLLRELLAVLARALGQI